MAVSVGSAHTAEPRRNTRAWLALGAVALAVVATGAWGLAAPGGSASAAAPGEGVAVPGGIVRVEQIRDEKMMNMAAMGMNMAPAPHTTLPDPPKGFRRVSVVVSLEAGAGPGLRFRPGTFRLGLAGERGVVPAGIDTGPSRVPPGTAASRSLAFDVPESLSRFVLTMDDADRPFAIDVSPAHGHGAAAAGATRVGPGPVVRTLTRNGYTVSLRLAPNRAAVPAALSVRIARGGRPLAHAHVAARITMTEMAMGSESFPLRELGSGTYRASAPMFAMPGTWSVAVTVKPRSGAPFSLSLADTVAG